MLNGPATIAEFETVLGTLTYNNLSTDPDLAVRLIAFTVNDGVDDSVATTLISIIPDSTAPDVGSNTGATVDEGSDVVIDPANLSFTDLQPPGSIIYTVTNSPSNGVLSLSTNPSGTPVNSANQLFDITVLPVNDDPILLNIEALPAIYTENSTVGITGNLSIIDKDLVDQIQSATVTISNNYVASEDELTFTSQPGITGIFSNGVLSLTGAASIAEYEAVIHSVAYRNLSDDPSVVQRHRNISGKRSSYRRS